MGKLFTEVKAEPLTASALESWLAGERPRRIMVVPFGGPIPGGKAGLDLDGEYFDEETDLYGPFPALRASRRRLVDWHHDSDAGVPAGVPSMKGAILGEIELDAGPSRLAADDGTEYEGVAADFWANAGEQRLALVKALSRRGAAIYGSSQAVRGSVRKAADGHIELWPLYRHTLSTSPQNTHAVVPSLKAVLGEMLLTDTISAAALKAAVLDLDGPEAGFQGAAVAAAGAGGQAGPVIDRATEALLNRAVETFAARLAGVRRP